MGKLSLPEWIAVGSVALIVAVIVVIVGNVGLQTYREHQALLNIVGYNLQQGKLVTVPVQAPPAATKPPDAAPKP